MSRYLLAIIFCVLGSCTANAQFFDFDFFSPFSTQRKQQEPLTLPEYRGGSKKLNEYIEKHYKNPTTRVYKSGTIIVSCVLNEKGKVIETHIARSFNKAYDKEAIRVAKKLKFTPAKRGKKKIKGQNDIVFPIRNGRLSYSTLNVIEI